MPFVNVSAMLNIRNVGHTKTLKLKKKIPFSSLDTLFPQFFALHHLKRLPERP